MAIATFSDDPPGRTPDAPGRRHRRGSGNRSTIASPALATRGRAPHPGSPASGPDAGRAVPPRTHARRSTSASRPGGPVAHRRRAGRTGSPPPAGQDRAGHRRPRTPAASARRQARSRRTRPTRPGPCPPAAAARAKALTAPTLIRLFVARMPVGGSSRVEELVDRRRRPARRRGNRNATATSSSSQSRFAERLAISLQSRPGRVDVLFARGAPRSVDAHRRASVRSPVGYHPRCPAGPCRLRAGPAADR